MRSIVPPGGASAVFIPLIFPTLLILVIILLENLVYFSIINSGWSGTFCAHELRRIFKDNPVLKYLSGA